MNHKQMPRLGSAIASTILSVFWAVSLVGVDKAQAALLTYNFDAGNSYVAPPSRGISYFKVDNSSVTGIGFEYIPVPEGRLYEYTLAGGQEYYDLAGFSTLFYQGEFRGLNAHGNDVVRGTSISTPDEPGPPFSLEFSSSIIWSIDTNPGTLSSLLNGYYQLDSSLNGGPWVRSDRAFYWDVPVTYTLVKTETVPEPLTAGGTALALAGLSWLKHQKKMAA